MYTAIDVRKARATAEDDVCNGVLTSSDGPNRETINLNDRSYGRIGVRSDPIVTMRHVICNRRTARHITRLSCETHG
jgi:hypothetical protein